MGFLKGSNAVHYHSEATERPEYLRLISKGKLLDGIAADDGVAPHFVGGKLLRAVSSRPDACAYRVTRADSKAVEEEVSTDYLGDK